MLPNEQLAHPVMIFATLAKTPRALLISFANIPTTEPPPIGKFAIRYT